MEEGGLEIKDRKYRFKTYAKCFVGTQFVKWLIVSKFANDEKEAVLLGQKMNEKGLFFHVCRDHEFKNEELFYRFIEQDRDRGHAVPNLSW